MKLIKQFFSYMIVGFFAMVIDFSALYFFVDILGVYYLKGIIIAFFMAASFSFIFQKKYTFKNKNKKHLSQFLTFLVVSVIGVGINLLVVFFSVELFGLWYMFGKIIATGIVLVWNFSLNKTLVFV